MTPPRTYLTKLRPVVAAPGDRAILERRIRWIDALRSGAYAQTRGVLFRAHHAKPGTIWPEAEPGYCCLGVAAAACHLPVVRLFTEGSVGLALLPLPDSLALGLDLAEIPEGEEEHSTLAPSSIQDKLAGMNDADGMSFAEIANVIEDWTATQLYAGVSLSGEG